MWKEVPRTQKKEVLSSHLVESSRPSLTTVRLEVPYININTNLWCLYFVGSPITSRNKNQALGELSWKCSILCPEYEGR